MHVLTADQFTPEQMGHLFEESARMQHNIATRAGRVELFQRYAGEQVVSLFYEPSTRTKGSFEIAAMKLGMGVYETENAGEFSSIVKGETIEDSTRVLDYDIAAIIMRTKEEGIAARAAAVSTVPVINAGDGKAEHPTQAALDMYTIQKKKGRLDNLHIVIGGDLKQGRTARSLSKLLAKYPDNHITYVSTPEYRMGDDILSYLQERGTSYDETVDMYAPLASADVVYWTRLQKERLEGEAKDAPTKSVYIIDAQALQVMNKDAIIMHPLPRNDEIAKSVDADPRAHYFQQAKNGLYVRMALLDQAAALRV